MKDLFKKIWIASVSLTIAFSSFTYAFAQGENQNAIEATATTQETSSQETSSQETNALSEDKNSDKDDSEEEEEHISLTPTEENIGILEKSQAAFYMIKDIWHDAFNYKEGSELNPGTYMNYYVNNIFTKYDTFVYMHDGRAVAMAMIIPTNITLSDGAKKDGYYIYAVGTKKEYQNNGISTLMLDYIDRYAKSKGKEFRILNPDKRFEWLINFYGKRGYETIDTRRIFMSADEVLEAGGDAETLVYQNGFSTVEDLLNCRRVNLGKETSFVEWDLDDLKIVRGEYKLEKAKNYTELYFGDWQYAILKNTKTYVYVKEFYIKEENKEAFFKTLATLYEGKPVVFDVPDLDSRSNFFDGKEYNSYKLSMINFKWAEDLKEKVRKPVYFNFGMD